MGIVCCGPDAAPMLGGLATSAFLTLEVLPVLYTIWRARQLAREERATASDVASSGVPEPLSLRT